MVDNRRAHDARCECFSCFLRAHEELERRQTREIILRNLIREGWFALDRNRRVYYSIPRIPAIDVRSITDGAPLGESPLQIQTFDYSELERRLLLMYFGVPPAMMDALMEELVNLQRVNKTATRESISGHDLLKRAKTIRERVFSRIVNTYITTNHKITMKIPSRPKPLAPPASKYSSEFELEPKNKGTSPRTLMRWCRNHEKARLALKKIPIVSTSKIADPEVHVVLQDLADIVAWEASEAFTAKYYPGVPGVDPIEPDHVKKIMLALQREVNREAEHKPVGPAEFKDLPWERQVALAERRRYWFLKFGITPWFWKRGYFNLWNVANEPMPEGIYLRYDTNEVRYRQNARNIV